MRDHALRLLRTALNDPHAEFRDGQWECIERLLNGERLLVVQRTGWGKSMVYFLATRLLRESGKGPTLLVSPLLSLMRNQIEAAERIRVRAQTINSANTSEWDAIEQELRGDKIDILLISPERLADNEFRKNVLQLLLISRTRAADNASREHVLPPAAAREGLFVVDEAHCISDWGHDFRPDYRRIVGVVEGLLPRSPVLATTATANSRVTADVASQLGNVTVLRGPLRRDSLRLQNLALPSPTDRMAWLAQTVPTLPSSGIVYVLTRRDAERVAEWLRGCSVAAEAYHAGLAEEDENAEDSDQRRGWREALEQRLLTNDVKVLVATVALGMGFDKPDLGFVIHFQRPASVVHYYQQVGRAGRAIGEAYGVLLHGAEDDDIAEYFRTSAFPPQEHADAILEMLGAAEGGLSVPELEARMNLKRAQIEKALKYMSVEASSPVTKLKSKWSTTAASLGYRVDREKVQAILGIRVAEQEEMRRYMEHAGCLMEFLTTALDDPGSAPCGVCAGCRKAPLLSPEVDGDLANRAALYLRRAHLPLPPRRLWPKGAFPICGFSGRIDGSLVAEEGLVLSTWRDAGWGDLVAKGKYETARFDDELVQACAGMIRGWSPSPSPEWMTCIPSLDRPELVPEFARKLADALGLPFCASLKKVARNRPQKEMQNNYQQAHNLDGVFAVDPTSVNNGPCLLVDDVVGSGWTMTVAAALLRQAGCGAVFPLALAQNSLGNG